MDESFQLTTFGPWNSGSIGSWLHDKVKTNSMRTAANGNCLVSRFFIVHSSICRLAVPSQRHLKLIYMEEAWDWISPISKVRSWENLDTKIQWHQSHAMHVRSTSCHLVYQVEISQVSLYKMKHNAPQFSKISWRQFTPYSAAKIEKNKISSKRFGKKMFFFLSI